MSGKLVLSRKRHEVIVIHDRLGTVIVRCEVDRIKGDKVRLAFSGPEDVGIDREEVYRSKCEQVDRTGNTEP